MNDNSNTQSENLSGGGTRVSFGVPAANAPPPSAPASTRVCNDSYRWNAGGGGMETSGITRFTHNPAGESGGDIMSSRLHTCGHDTVCFEPGNEGTRVQLAFALKEGFIREVSAGVYEDARRRPALQLPVQQSVQPAQLSGPEGPAREGEPQTEEPELQGVFSAEEDAAWQVEFAEVPESAFNAAMAAWSRQRSSGRH